jgi:hypothetical protein
MAETVGLGSRGRDPEWDAHWNDCKGAELPFKGDVRLKEDIMAFFKTKEEKQEDKRVATEEKLEKTRVANEEKLQDREDKMVRARQDREK